MPQYPCGQMLASLQQKANLKLNEMCCSCLLSGSVVEFMKLLKCCKVLKLMQIRWVYITFSKLLLFHLLDFVFDNLVVWKTFAKANDQCFVSRVHFLKYRRAEHSRGGEIRCVSEWERLFNIF